MLQQLDRTSVRPLPGRLRVRSPPGVREQSVHGGTSGSQPGRASSSLAARTNARDAETESAPDYGSGPCGFESLHGCQCSRCPKDGRSPPERVCAGSSPAGNADATDTRSGCAFIRRARGFDFLRWHCAAIAQLVEAPLLQGGGRGFDPRSPYHVPRDVSAYYAFGERRGSRP